MHYSYVCAIWRMCTSSRALPRISTPLQRSPINDVQSALLDVERGFANCFAQGRVRMTCTADVFRAATEFNYRNRFGASFRCSMMQNVRAENTIGFGVG